MRSIASLFSWSVVLILLVGVILRIAYIDHSIYHVDEQIGQGVIQNLSFPDQWDTNWSKSAIRSGFHYDQYNFSSYHYTLFFWQKALSLFDIDGVKDAWALRALNGIFGLVFIGAIALAARNLVGEIAGIAAAAAGAVIPILVEDAHYVRCESMLTAGVAILLWFSSLPSPKNRGILISAGLIAGWLVACKITMGIALPLLLLLLFPKSSSKPMRWDEMVGAGSIICLGCALGFFLGMPWGVIQPNIYLSGLAALAKHYRSPMWPFTAPDMAPSLYVTLIYFKHTLGWGFWIISGLGIIGMGKRVSWQKIIILLVPFAVALAVFGSHAIFAERSYSPFLPIAVAFFGAGSQFILDAFLSSNRTLKHYHTSLVFLWLVFALFVPAIYSWQIVYQGFSGREQIKKDDALSRMKGDLTGKVIRMFNANSHPQQFIEISECIAKREPALVVVVDFYDAISPRCVATLQQVYGGRVLGVREGLFPELPTCFLNTLISPRLWLIYVPAKAK